MILEMQFSKGHNSLIPLFFVFIVFSFENQSWCSLYDTHIFEYIYTGKYSSIKVVFFCFLYQVFRDIDDSLLLAADQITQVESLGKGAFGVVCRGFLHREVSKSCRTCFLLIPLPYQFAYSKFLAIGSQLNVVGNLSPWHHWW